MFRSSAGIALLASAAVLGLVGLGFCLFGTYVALDTVFGPAVAAVLTGLASLVLMLIVLWIATHMAH